MGLDLGSQCHYAAQHMAKQLSDVLDFFGSLRYVLFFMVLNHSKLANLGFLTYCNIFLMILELPTNQTKMDPRTPYLLPEYFKKIRAIWKHVINILVF